MAWLIRLLPGENNLFFCIGANTDTRFPNNHQVGNLWINFDNGWQIDANIFYKGYSDNYCKIIVDSSGAKIEHSHPRSFPLYYQQNLVTNFDSTLTQAWTDDTVSIDNTGNITLTKNCIDLAVDNTVLNIAQAKTQICQLLDKKVKQVPSNIKLFCSGGIDTLLLYSMLNSFDLVTEEHYEHDAFTNNNQEALKKFWAYKQIHHWTESTWLATGSHGDEYFLRGPAVIAMLTAWHGINFGQLLADNPNCYHYYHFNKYSELWKNSWDNRYQLREEYPTINSLHNQVLNILVNDYQHWHLGNTLTWTPFKDIEISKILLQCPINELIPQFLDGRLSKDLIIDYNDNIIDYLSRYKNHNSKENLLKLYEYHAKSAGSNG
jgi:hypothetical protein